MLRFRRLRLKNWKNFRNVDIALRDRMFLVGPNASGKSNLLDAFRFLRDVASSGGGFSEAVRRREGVSAIRCLAARRHSDIEVGVELRDDEDGAWTYELAFNQDNQRHPVLRTERVLRNGGLISERPDREDRSDAARLTQTHLEQMNVNYLPFRDLTGFFASIRYLHIVPQLVREPNRSVGTSNDPFGGDFLEQIAQTKAKIRDARMRRIRDALCVAVPQLEKIELTRDGCGVPHLRVRHEHWRHGAWQSERQLSDGTLRLMGLLWAAMDGGGPLLLKGPELSLHPEIVRVLPQMLARVRRRNRRQIFLITHSPEMLLDTGIGLDETLLFVTQKEGTRVIPAATVREIRQLLGAGLSLAEIVIPKTRPADVSQLSFFAGAPGGAARDPHYRRRKCSGSTARD